MEDNTPWINIDLLKPHPQNPREHTPEQIKKIANEMHISMSALLALALRKYIKEIEKQEKEN